METPSFEKAQEEIAELTAADIHAPPVTDRDGELLICLQLGKNYALNVSKEGYLFHSENFALVHRDTGKPYVLEIGLQKIPESLAQNQAKPVPAPKPIVLKNVFFDTGSADLREESFAELRRLKKLLVDNPTMRIQVSGHTDNIGSEEANFQLSTDRARSVYEFLVREGINEVRLSYKGFGESQSIDTNESAEGRQRNRRTEFMIIGI